MKFTKTLIAASFALTSTHSFAAAFQLAEQNASGLGRAYAGEASAADDASVVARNPALMTLFTDKQFSIAASSVMPDVSLKGTSTNNGMDASVLNDSSIAPSAIIPAAYFTMPLNERVSLGFGAFSNFGLATKFDNNYAAGQIAGETEIVTINMNASAAYKATEQLSVAFGLNYIYADAKIIRKFGATNTGIPASADAVNLQGDDTGYGFNVGLMYQLDDNSRFGFHYRSETDVTFKGDYSNQLPTAVTPLGLNGMAVLPGTVALSLPAIAEVSGSHQVNETVGVHYSAMWTGWSSFKTLESEITLPSGAKAIAFNKDESFSNAMRYSIGADYQYSPQLLLRAGIAFDESPVSQEHLSISIPDTDRFWFSFGGNYAITEHSNFDLGLSIIRGKTQSFSEEDNIGNQWSFESKGHALLFAAQYNYKF